MTLNTKRIYDESSPVDGFRILVDRLWPRGLKKVDARINEWLREIAPSDALRRWFGHDAARWGEFKRRYFAELDGKPDVWSSVLERTRDEPVTLLYAASDVMRNNAVALKLYLEQQNRHMR